MFVRAVVAFSSFQYRVFQTPLSYRIMSTINNIGANVWPCGTLHYIWWIFLRNICYCFGAYGHTRHHWPTTPSLRVFKGVKWKIPSLTLVKQVLLRGKPISALVYNSTRRRRGQSVISDALSTSDAIASDTDAIWRVVSVVFLSSYIVWHLFVITYCYWGEWCCTLTTLNLVCSPTI